MSDRESYEAAQAEHFDSNYEEFLKPLPDDVEKNLTRIVGSCSGLGADSRVVDAGAGTGRLIPHLRRAGVKDILAVDLSAAMLAQLQQRYCTTTSSLGNEPGVRCWLGSFLDLPNYMGPVTAVFFNSVFGNFLSPRQALLHAALLLAPGGQVLISHPLGREWQRQLHRAQPQFVPHPLPSQDELQDMIADLPLRITKLVDDPSLYIACLQVPKQYELAQGPVTLQGTVVYGFGRGSRDMGTPTANVDPMPIQDQLQSLPWGVYFGWAQLAPEEGFSPADLDVHPMVLNIGARPTMDDAGGVSVEAHIMHTFPRDFYGGSLTLLLAGFLRPEMKFGSLPQLLARIKRDIGTAKATLATPELQALRNSDVFRC